MELCRQTADLVDDYNRRGERCSSREQQEGKHQSFQSFKRASSLSFQEVKEDEGARKTWFYFLHEQCIQEVGESDIAQFSVDTEDQRIPILDRGVSIRFLEHMIEDLHHLGMDDANSDNLVFGFYEGVPLSIKKSTQHTGLSFVETCIHHGITHDCQNRPYFGKTKNFISYTWRGTEDHPITFVALVDAIKSTLYREGLNADEMFFFVDIFTCSQHRRDRSQNLKLTCPNTSDVGRFDEVIGSCDRFVFYCTPVTQPLALGRVWCLFELMTAHQLGLTINIALGKRDEKILQNEILKSVSFMLSLFTNIDAKNAQATFPEDRERIFSMITEGVGFSKLNSVVSNLMRKWISSSAKHMLETISENSEEKAEFCYGVAAALHEMRELSEARKYYHQCLAMREMIAPENKLSIALVRNNLGAVEKNVANYESARSHYEKSLQLKHMVLNPDDPGIAICLSNLGNVEYKLEKYEEALKNYQEAMKILTKIDGIDANKASLYNNLGNIFDCNGDTQGAKEHYRKCLEMRQELFTNNHPDVARAMHNMGLIMHREGSLDDAKSLTEESLRIKKEVMSPIAADLGMTLNNLGCIYHSFKCYDKAQDTLAESLEIFLKTLKHEHPLVRSVENNIKKNLLDLRRMQLEESPSGLEGEDLSKNDEKEDDSASCSGNMKRKRKCGDENDDEKAL